MLAPTRTVRSWPCSLQPESSFVGFWSTYEVENMEGTVVKALSPSQSSLTQISQLSLQVWGGGH